jgi:hypothetical protein
MSNSTNELLQRLVVSNERIGQAVTALETHFVSLDRRLTVVESHPPPTVQSVRQVATGSSGTTRKSRRARRQERAALRQSAAPPPTPAATSAARVATATALPSLPKAALEKIVVTLSVPDAVAGHLVGRAGTGLRQIHDISHAKVSVSQVIGPSASRAVTIRGTSREVGDAVSVIGKRIARRRVRQPKPKKSGKEKSTRPQRPVRDRPAGTSSSAPTATPTPGPSTPALPRASGSSTPRASTSSAPAPAAPSVPSTSAAASPQPMSGVQSAGPSSHSTTSSPMQVDAARVPSSSSVSRSSDRPRQTARRGGGPPS